jgi:hypothetical protein
MSLQSNLGLAFARLVAAVNALAGRSQPAGGATGQVLTKTSAVDYASAWQTPAGGSGGGGTWVTVEVDFGAVFAYQQRTFVVAVAGAALGQKVQATPSLAMPVGVAMDEMELNPVTALAAVTAVDTVTLVVASLRGPVWGKRNINLTLG